MLQNHLDLIQHSLTPSRSALGNCDRPHPDYQVEIHRLCCFRDRLLALTAADNSCSGQDSRCHLGELMPVRQITATQTSRLSEVEADVP